MADSTNAPSSRQRIGRGCGGCLTVFFLATGLAALVAGIYGMTGTGRAMSFECTRATGDCVVHDRVDRHIALSTIQSVAVSCGDVHVSTNLDEWQCDLEATLATGGTQSLAEGSGDATSEAEYRSAAAAISAFLSGSTPSVHADYSVREGTTSTANDTVMGLFSLLLGALGAYVLWKTRRAATRDGSKE
jgi:hypothetical protein